ncbi:MAG: bifunctional oligoribonuclease/PAP phosphatase NrnA, partial [Syntrophobacterales bacterium]|nr:bifunctional oligoribonuclease/PAP phosphatase NrnA [Syntrophobacterales bacterium]
MMREIIESIHQHRSFLLTSHMRPDGDSLGSELALYHLLRFLGKDVTVYNQDQTPFNYRFLPGSEVIVHTIDHPGQYDAAIIVDCNGLGRIGNGDQTVAQIKRLINIDHHIAYRKDFHFSYVDASASSTGELVYRLIVAMGIEITPPMAINLFTAIMTDTGRFCHKGTNKETFLAAGDLVACGADPQFIGEQVYGSNQEVKIYLLKRALETLHFDLEGRVGSMVIFQQDFVDLDAKYEHTENFVDLAKEIHTVDISVFYTEMEPNVFKASFRSKGDINVEKIASSFGGGGHINAASCYLDGPFAAAHERVLTAA